MPDRFSKEIRSRIMSRIRGKDTKPEIKLRKALHGLGYRYSLRHRFSEIRCTPDITMVSGKTVVFVDGCFWHRCPRCFRAPKSNRRYWGPKIERNVQRDKEQTRWLRRHGWKVIRVWEHQIRENLGRTAERIAMKIEEK
jgi:DNA mismatch endonuclease (patch repair protein)